MTRPQQVRFLDEELEAVLAPFLAGPLSWARFFTAAEELADRPPAELVRLQALLVEEVVAGRYGGLRRTDGPVTFLDADGSLPGGIAFGEVVSPDDALSFALADLDAMRDRGGERATRRWARSVAAGQGAGYVADVRLMTVLPRAHRLRTGTAMPGYRAYAQEEAAAPGARDETCLVVLEVVHDGVPGLIALEVSACSDFQLEDELARDVAALRALLPFEVLHEHRGERLPAEWGLDWRRARDGVVLFRGGVDVPPADEAWVAAVRAAMLKPARRRKALSSADVWATIAAAGPGDPDVLAEALAAALVTWTPARIRAFDAGLRRLLAELDTPELLAAASVSFGWLSDDAWEDVRSGVIAQGGIAHAAALRDPSTFAWASVEPGESLLSAASDAHETLTDERIVPDDTEPAPSGRSAVVVSRRADVVCVRWWADAVTARDRHLAAEGAGTEVLAVHADLDRSRVRDDLLFVGPGPLL